MYHRDLSPDLFPQLRIGSHMNLLPTLIETIAPKGFPYYSLAPSLYEPLSHVVTPYHWLDDQSVGYYADKIAQPLCPRDAAIRREVENSGRKRTLSAKSPAGSSATLTRI